MKKINIIMLLFMLTINPLNAQNDVISAFLLKWENSKNYLIEMAELMPKEKYNYQPTVREMSFQEQLLHIKNNMIWLSSTYFMDKNYIKSNKTEPKTKTETIAAMVIAFDKVTNIIKNVSLDDLPNEVDFFAGKKSKLQILNLMQDHVTHHRGQLIVYLNLNEIKPPKYSGW